MCLTVRRGDYLAKSRAFGPLQQCNQHRLLGARALGRRLCFRRLVRGFADRGHRLHHHRLDANRQQSRIGDHQRGAVVVAGFPPERFAPAQVGVNLLQSAVADHLGDGHLRRDGTTKSLILFCCFLIVVRLHCQDAAQPTHRLHSSKPADDRPGCAVRSALSQCRTGLQAVPGGLTAGCVKAGTGFPQDTRDP